MNAIRKLKTKDIENLIFPIEVQYYGFLLKEMPRYSLLASLSGLMSMCAMRNHCKIGKIRLDSI